MKYIIKGVVNLILAVIILPLIFILIMLWVIKLMGGKRFYADDPMYSFIERWTRIIK